VIFRSGVSFPAITLAIGKIEFTTESSPLFTEIEPPGLTSGVFFRSARVSGPKVAPSQKSASAPNCALSWSNQA
jgi:hypothetical protein